MTRVSHFSIENARRALSYVRPILEDARAAYGEFLALQHEATDGDNGLSARERHALVARMREIRQHLNGFLAEIASVGAEVKDFESGLCDFPYLRRNGEVVLLCYRLDEETITTWHTREGGFTNRRPVDELVEEERAART